MGSHLLDNPSLNWSACIKSRLVRGSSEAHGAFKMLLERWHRKNGGHNVKPHSSNTLNITSAVYWSVRCSNTFTMNRCTYTKELRTKAHFQGNAPTCPTRLNKAAVDVVSSRLRKKHRERQTNFFPHCIQVLKQK